MTPRALWRRSVSLRVTVIVSALVLGVALAAAAVQYQTTRGQLQRQLEQALQADLDGFAALYEQRRVIALREAMEYRGSTDDQLMTLLLDRSGGRLGGTLLGWPEDVPALGQGFSTAAAQVFVWPDGSRWFGVARLLPGGFPFLVARSMAPMEETLAHLRRSIALMALGIVAIAGLAGWLVARALLGRIDRLNALADRVGAGHLDARLPGPPRDDELGRLETHMQGMLDRIGRLMAGTRRLSDGIAHELRTPLTRLQTHLTEIDAPAEQVAALRDEMRATIRVFDSLLDIASAEAGTDRAGLLEPVDLSALCADMAELYEPMAEDEGLVFGRAIVPGAEILGDRNLIAQLLTNVLDNALKYTRRGDSLDLSLADEGDTWVLTLADSGPGIPDALRPVIFEQFSRAERDRHIRGHGLGLALVQAIATRHGAKAEVPGVEKGFAIRVRFPKLGAAA